MKPISISISIRFVFIIKSGIARHGMAVAWYHNDNVTQLQTSKLSALPSYRFRGCDMIGIPFHANTLSLLLQSEFSPFGCKPCNPTQTHNNAESGNTPTSINIPQSEIVILLCRLCRLFQNLGDPSSRVCRNSKASTASPSSLASCL